MGLNISLYKVHNRDVHTLTEDTSFDFIRSAGDAEFSTYTSATWEFLFCTYPYCCDWIFRRPTDFEQSRKWIREHIPASGQERLLAVVDLMEQDEDLWLYFG